MRLRGRRGPEMWIALSVKVSFAEVRWELEGWFPRATVGDLEHHLDHAGEDWPSMVLSVSHLPGPFPTLLSFATYPGAEQETGAISTELGRRFSEAYRCRTACDGSAHGVPRDGSWMVIWDAGRAFLARESGGGDAIVPTIVRELSLSSCALDSRGLLVPRVHLAPRPFDGPAAGERLGTLS
jgi:hypothetical protein